ncbi:diguanylate cyclase (GGDEF)-like protein/PAS domain S-box-containing protein [Mycobacterium sp. MAA66]|uniref:diguanylate cyclase domain-containing protein n=1 Tax=Mycobacterium sp. MAA66 TaxID=3156297 RepID=UPI003519028D
MATGPGDASTSTSSAASPDDGERRYRQLLEHSPYPMCVHSEGRVVYVNPAGIEGIAARSADDVVGRMITDFVHPDSIAPMLARIASLRREGDNTAPSEATMLRLDGSPLPVEVVSVLTSWDGKPAYQVVFRDLTVLKAAEAALHDQAALVAHATDAIISTTATGVVTSWNPAAQTIYRRSAASALGCPISKAVGATVDPAAIVAQGGVEQHTSHRAADGTVLTVRVSAAAMDDGYVLVCSDHTALRRAEQRFQTVVDSLDEGVVVLDAQRQPEWINPAGRRILGMAPDGPLLENVDPSVDFPLYDVDGHPLADQRRPFAAIMATSTAVRNQIVGYQQPGGPRKWLSVSCRFLDPADSGQPAVLITFTDVTDQHLAQLRLTHQAHHDALTGLPNRAYAEKRVSRAIETEMPPLVAVMFIDLDNIKTFNDAFGHHAGDTVIKTAAQRLRCTLRTEDFVARHGGDEFVALLFGPADRATLDRLADRLHSALAAPIDIAGTPCGLTASIGVTQVRPDDPRDASQILQDADSAMYRAKVYRAATRYAEDPL